MPVRPGISLSLAAAGSIMFKNFKFVSLNFKAVELFTRLILFTSSNDTKPEVFFILVGDLILLSDFLKLSGIFWGVLSFSCDVV